MPEKRARATAKKRASKSKKAAPQKPGPRVFVSSEHGPHRGVSTRQILSRAEAMLDALQLKKAELSILLTDDPSIHRLNREYRKKDRPTDVLAFAFREGEFGNLAETMLGDVVVSVPTARRQASERSVSVLDEVTMLLAHGLLHLLGWDHQTDETDRKMRRKTASLVRAATRD